MFFSGTNEELAQQKRIEEGLIEELIASLQPKYEVAKDFRGVKLTAKTSSGFYIHCQISLQLTSANGPYAFALTVPSTWESRLQLKPYFSGPDLHHFLTIWEALIQESETVLAPEPAPAYNLETRQQAVSTILNDLQVLTEACRQDAGSDEALAIAKELQIHLSEDSCLDNIWSSDIKGCYHLGALTYRSYFIEYKGRGFILCDIGNGNWSYVATVEEFLLNYHWDTLFHATL